MTTPYAQPATFDPTQASWTRRSPGFAKTLLKAPSDSRIRRALQSVQQFGRFEGRRSARTASCGSRVGNPPKEERRGGSREAQPGGRGRAKRGGRSRGRRAPSQEERSEPDGERRSARRGRVGRRRRAPQEPRSQSALGAFDP